MQLSNKSLLQTKRVIVKPLGKVLQTAGLISGTLLEQALKDQSQFHHLRLGEILVGQGYIKPKTVDFFARQWPTIVMMPSKGKPLGEYFKQADLLSEEQIQQLLVEQARLEEKIRFGTLAVYQGYIKQTTLNFFVRHLVNEERAENLNNNLMDSLGRVRSQQPNNPASKDKAQSSWSDTFYWH